MTLHFISTTATLTPVILFYFVLKFGSTLVRIHWSTCAALCESLMNAGKATLTFKGNATGPTVLMVEHQALRMQDRFKRLKECFKIYEQLAGVFVFCIVWWIFVVIITTFSSLTSQDWGNGLTALHILNYGLWCVAFIFMVASFGEYMASSIGNGKEAIADAMSRVGGSKLLEDEGKAMIVSVFY